MNQISATYRTKSSSSNIRVIVVPESQCAEKIFEKIRAPKLYKFDENYKSTCARSSMNSSKINTKKSTPNTS